MTILFTLIRAVHFATSLLPLSVFATLLLVATPATDGEMASYHRRLRYLLAVCFVAGLLSGICWFWFSIAGMSGFSLRESLDAHLFKMVLLQTTPGRVWIFRALAALLLTGATVIYFSVRRAGIKLPALLFCIFSSAYLAGSLAWLGHAGAGEGALANLHLAADVLHLISAAVWPGGLLPFAMLMRLLLNSRNPGQLAAACVATRRFSSVSLATVGFLAVSGGVNGYFMLGNLPALFSTQYGRLLLLKLALFAGMIAIGALNLLFFKPRLSGVPKDVAELRQITGNVMMELCLGTALLLVVGILGITPPAIHP